MSEYDAFSSPVQTDPYAAFSSPAKDKPNSFIDAVRAIPGGLVKGVTGIAGLPGTVSDLASSGLDYLANKLTGANIHTSNNPLSASKLTDVAGKPTGGFYQPQTTLGKYAETAATFAPAAFGGEASLPARLMGRVLAPAAGSMAAGAAVPDSDPTLKGIAETGGAVLGGGLAGGSRALGRALLGPKKSVPEIARDYTESLVDGQGTTHPAIATVPAGKGATAAEAIGPSGISALATLGRRPGTTGEALSDALLARSNLAPARMQADFAQAAGIDPAAAQGKFDNILEAGQKRAAPLYKDAYAQNQNIASPMLDKILETPAGKQALSDARVKMQNDMSLMGTPDADLMDQAKEGATAIPSKGVASGMKLRVYDYVKQSLDDQIDAAYRGGNKNEGNIIKGLKNSLVKQLDQADVTAQAGPNSLKPEGGSYSQARKAAGDYLGAKQAFEDAGDHILNPNVPVTEVQKYFGDLSDTGQGAYKAGIANRVFMQAQNGRLSPRILNTPAIRGKLEATLGKPNTDEFLSRVNQELSLAKSGARMMPNTNSITADILMNAGAQDHGKNIEAGLAGTRAIGHALTGNIPGAVAGGLSAARHFFPDLVKSGGLNEAGRNEAGRLLMLSPQEYVNQVKQLPPPQQNAKLLSQLLMLNK